MANAKELALLIAARDAASPTLKAIQKELKNVRADLGNTGKAAESSGKGFASGFGSMAAGAAKLGLVVGAVTATAGAIAGLGAVMLGGNREFEQYTVQFSVLLKSMGAAKARMEELQRVNVATPFQLDELVRADKVLTGFGLHSAEAAKAFGKAGSEIRMIAADVAAGTGQSMEAMAGYLGRFSQGSVGEAMQRFAELGIVTRGELAAMGVEFNKSGELVSPLDEAMSTLLKAMEAKFGGMAIAQSQTFDGMFSNVQDWVANTTRKMSEPMFDAAKMGMQALLDKLADPELNRSVDDISEAIWQSMNGEVVPAVMAAAAAIGGLPDLAGAVAQDMWRPFKWLGDRLGDLGRMLDEMTPVRKVVEFGFGLTQSPEVQKQVRSVLTEGIFPKATGVYEKWAAGITKAQEEAYAKAQERKIIRMLDIDARSIREVYNRQGGATAGPKWTDPKMAGKMAGTDGSKKAEQEAEKIGAAYGKAVDGMDQAIRQLEFDTMKAGERAGEAWIEAWFAVDEAIRQAQAASRKALADMETAEKLERSIRDRRRDFGEGQASADRERRWIMEKGQLELDYAQQLQTLRMDSWDQQFRTEEIGYRRRRDDEDELWNLERALGKATTEDDKKAVRERFKEQQEVLAYRRKREDEDREWQLDRERKALEHKKALDKIAMEERRKLEDADLEWRKSQEQARQDFEDVLAREASERRKAEIEAEETARIASINNAWDETQAKIAKEKDARIKAAREEAQAKLVALKEEFTDKLADSNAPGLEKLRALIEEKFGALFMGVAGGGIPSGVDPRHYPGGDVFDAWWAGLSKEGREAFARERPDWPLPSMDTPGVVPGPWGAVVPVLARGGERFGGFPPATIDYDRLARAVGSRPVVLQVDGRTLATIVTTEQGYTRTIG